MARQVVNPDNIDIHQDAADLWNRAALNALVLLPELPATPVERRAEVLCDGALRLYAPHPTRRRRVLVEIIVPAGYWVWIN